MVIKQKRTQLIGLLFAGALAFCQSQSLFSAAHAQPISTPKVITVSGTNPGVSKIKAGTILASLLIPFCFKKQAHKENPSVYKNPSAWNLLSKATTAFGYLYAGTHVAQSNRLLSPSAGILKNICGQVLSRTPLALALAEETTSILGLEEPNQKQNNFSKVADLVKGITAATLTSRTTDWLCNMVPIIHAGETSERWLPWAAAVLVKEAIKHPIKKFYSYTINRGCNIATETFNAVTDNRVGTAIGSTCKKVGGFFNRFVPKRSWLPSWSWSKKEPTKPTYSNGSTGKHPDQ